MVMLPPTHATPTTPSTAQCMPDVRYGVCRQCHARAELLSGMDLQNTRCWCGSSLSEFAQPDALNAPIPGYVPKSLRLFWAAGREDGYWKEHNLLSGPGQIDGRVFGRKAWDTYCDGRRAGLRLRMRARTTRDE